MVLGNWGSDNRRPFPVETRCSRLYKEHEIHLINIHYRTRLPARSFVGAYHLINLINL